MVIPLVRTRDNLDLPAGHYAIKVHGVELGRGEAPPGAVMVIGEGLDSLPGVPTKEPVFGLDAIWVPTEFRYQAELMGATVVDRSSVVTTHLAEVVRQHAGRLLSRQDVRMLLDGVKSTDPAVSEELTAANVSLALDPEQAEKLAMEVVRVAQAAEQRGENPVLMCAGTLRSAVRRLVRNIAPGLPVLSYSELSPQLNVETLGVVSLGSSVAV